MITRSFGLGRALTESNNSFGNRFCLHPSLYWPTRSISVVFPFLDCLPPFQPERINPELNQKGYSVKSDIWSLGITMVTYDHHYGLWGFGHETGWSLGTQKQMLLTLYFGHAFLSEMAGHLPRLIVCSVVTVETLEWHLAIQIFLFYYHMTFSNSCILIDNLSNRHGVDQFLIVQIKWL